MICPACGGNVYTNLDCDRCGITYGEMIASIRHDSMRELIAKDSLSPSDELALAKELRGSSFLVPATFIGTQLNVMTAEDEEGRNYILLFTDRQEYDKNRMNHNPITNPFDEVLDLMDGRFEGFVINIRSEAYGVGRKFLDRHFPGEFQ